MNQLNSVILEGRLARDPIIKTTKSGKSVAEFTIANNRYIKQNRLGDGPDGAVEWSCIPGFYDINAWEALADAIGKEATKGRGVRVVGYLRQNRWVDSEGNHHSRVIIVAEHVEFKPITHSTTASDGGDDDDLDEDVL